MLEKDAFNRFSAMATRPGQKDWHRWSTHCLQLVSVSRQVNSWPTQSWCQVTDQWSLTTGCGTSNSSDTSTFAWARLSHQRKEFQKGQNRTNWMKTRPNLTFESSMDSSDPRFKTLFKIWPLFWKTIRRKLSFWTFRFDVIIKRVCGWLFIHFKTWIAFLWLWPKGPQIRGQCHPGCIQRQTLSGNLLQSNSQVLESSRMASDCRQQVCWWGTRHSIYHFCTVEINVHVLPVSINDSGYWQLPLAKMAVPKPVG